LIIYYIYLLSQEQEQRPRTKTKNKDQEQRPRTKTKNKDQDQRPKMLRRIATPTIQTVQKRTFMPDPAMAGAMITGLSVASGFIYSLTYRYKIAKPDEYLVRTGLFINDIRVDKKGYLFPFQRYKFIRMEPCNYEFNLQAMSREMVKFKLPGVFTIGPKNDPEALIKYARRLDNLDEDETGDRPKLRQLILGILEGEVRTASGQLTMEEIFNDRKKFKETIIGSIQEELDELGLLIINANIKELQDSEDSKYMHNVGQQKEKEIENRSKVSVAESQKAGDVGAKQFDAQKRQEVAKLESTTVTVENNQMQEQERALAALEVVKQQMFEKTNLARVTAENNYKLEEQRLQEKLEQQRVATETERIRVEIMTRARVTAESVRTEADAALYAKEKEASGIQALYAAQAAGLAQMYDALGKDSRLLAQYLFLQDGLYEKLAKTSATAIQGLQPKITVCNVGSNDQDYTKPIQDVLKMVPPVLTIMQDQFGIGLGSGKKDE
jgi:flotillin